MLSGRGLLLNMTNETLSKIRRSTSAKLRGVELPDCFAQSTVAAAACAYERDSKSAKVSRRRLFGKVERIQETDTTAEPRVPCPCCKGAGTCMLCDDNGLVPLSSVNADPRVAQHDKVRP